MRTINQFVRVKTLEEAYQLNQKRANVVLGGFMWLKLGNRAIQTAIDLSGLGLDGIAESAEAFQIGSMCTLRELEKHEGLNACFQGAIRTAVSHIVGVQFRNGATVGGSVFGRYGFSDVLTCLLALDCEVELYTRGLVPLREFVQMKPDNDILVRLRINKDGRRIAYQSQRQAKTDFPVIAVAVARKDDRLFVSVGARPMKAALIEKTVCFSGLQPAEAEIEKLANWARQQFGYGSNMRASGAYRQHLAGVYIRRGIQEVFTNER